VDVTAIPIDDIDDIVDLFEAIAARIEVDRDGCWIAADYAYPTIGYRGERIPLYRLMYTLCVGPLPPGHLPDHECHNQAAACRGGKHCRHKRCIRPDHLVARTPRDNLLAARRVFGVRPWIATVDLAVDLGLVDATADEMTRNRVALSLGKILSRVLPDSRATEGRPARDRNRRRGYYVEDLPDDLIGLLQQLEEEAI
jgi:hypothetical protein